MKAAGPPPSRGTSAGTARAATSATSASSASADRRRPREVRLIGGQWKRSKLPVADRPGLRPTPDRVRETVFNWLGQDLTGWRCLDAFAGSGALGYEAASRGASQVTLLEHDPAQVRSLLATRQRLQAGAVDVRRADAMTWMRSAPHGSFELAFIDPPFDAALAAAAADAAAALLVDGGYLYVETPAPLAAPPRGCEAFRAGRAGTVHFGLWRRRYTPVVTGPQAAPRP